MQWLQIAHGTPSIVFFSKSFQTIEVNLCFLLDWVAQVRSINGDGGLGGQGAKIGFSTWLNIIQSVRERERERERKNGV